MDEAKRDEIRAWIAKASQDLAAAEWLLASPEPLYGPVGFHCQQAAEKVLKAYLTWRNEPFEKTHSLVALVGKCLPFDTAFQSLRTAATTLTPYAVTSRYPGDVAELTATEAKEALELARQVQELVLKLLPSEIQA
jgi:HEPN domain-containing protein